MDNSAYTYDIHLAAGLAQTQEQRAFQGFGEIAIDEVVDLHEFQPRALDCTVKHLGFRAPCGTIWQVVSQTIASVIIATTDPRTRYPAAKNWSATCPATKPVTPVT